MVCQCPGCSKPAKPGGLLCQPCSDGIDAGRIGHPHDHKDERKPKSHVITDYYTVRLPSDLFAEGTPVSDYASQAIHEARERTRLYCIPAEWSAKLLSDEGGELVFRVTRKRMKGGE